MLKITHFMKINTWWKKFLQFCRFYLALEKQGLFDPPLSLWVEFICQCSWCSLLSFADHQTLNLNIISYQLPHRLISNAVVLFRKVICCQYQNFVKWHSKNLLHIEECPWEKNYVLINSIGQVTAIAMTCNWKLIQLATQIHSTFK